MPESADDAINVKLKNKTVSFGALGNFTYGIPKPLPTPPQALPPPPQQMSSKSTHHVYKLTKDECRSALVKYVSSKGCKSKKAAEECHLSDPKCYNAFDV